MKQTLTPGTTHTLTYVMPASKTVPQLYPESPEFAGMPPVFATGYMVGLMEWACMQLLAPHLDDGEGSLGISIDVDHAAATLPGQTISVVASCVEVTGRKIKFQVTAHDGVDRIGSGTHGRAVVPWDRFRSMVDAKAAKVGVPPLPVSAA